VNEEQKVDSNLWMVTFSDLVMLLLTFFVLLLAMSSMDTKKLESLFTHFTEATGVLYFSGSKEISSLGNFVNRYNDSSSLLVIDQNKLLNSIELPEILTGMVKDLNQKIEMTDDARGLVLSFHEDIIFDAGKATLKKEVFPILDAIADAIYECNNEILIMGHSDASPIKNDVYQSNWELSSDRGLAVLDYLLSNKGLTPLRFSVGGYGSSRPLYPNDSPAHRASNRRVEIIFKHLLEV